MIYLAHDIIEKYIHMITDDTGSMKTADSGMNNLFFYEKILKTNPAGVAATQTSDIGQYL